MGIKKAIAVELQKIKLEPNDCLFVKIDMDTFDFEEACRITERLRACVSEDINVIGYPSPGVEIQVVRKL